MSFFDRFRGGDSEEKSEEEMIEIMNDLKKEAAQKLVTDEQLEDFRRITEKNFKQEDIEINANTVAAFQSAFELIASDSIPEDGLMTMILGCERLKNDIKEDEEFFGNIEVKDE